MGKRARWKRKSKGGTLILKKTDESLRRRIREVGGEKVGVVPIDVAKQRVCAMITDFYGSLLREPELFPVTAAGLGLLDRRIAEAKQEHDLELVVIGLEQTGRLHEPVKRVLGRRWEIKMVHPLVTNHLRKGFSRNIKTEGMDVDAIGRAVSGCYGSPVRELPVGYQRWRTVHRAREQLVDERSALKIRMHERIHAVLPGLSAQFDNIWASPTAMLIIREMQSPAMLLTHNVEGLRKWCCQNGARCTRPRSEKLLAWAADAVSPGAASSTEAAILHDDVQQLAFLTRRIELYERQSLQFLVQTPFVLLLSIPGISHVLGGGLGAEAGAMHLYATARNLTGRAGLYPSRYQSDDTDPGGTAMAKGEPFLRDVLMKSGKSLSASMGAFFAWAESRRQLGRCEKKIAAAMANRYCRIAHAMVLSMQSFRHSDAKPGVSVIGKLLNVAVDLGIDPAELNELALQAAAWIPAWARPKEVHSLNTSAWKKDNRPRDYGSSPRTTRQVARETVPVILRWLKKPENQHDVAQQRLDFGPPA